MKTTDNKLPVPYRNVMITYKGTVRVPDKYYDRYETQMVKRLAFYSDTDGFYDSKDNWVETPNGFFHVPVDWRVETYSDGHRALQPSNFQTYGRVLPENVKEWHYHDKIKSHTNY